MDLPKRKFRSDINTKNIDELLEKRQRKRFSKPKNSPYEEHIKTNDTTSASNSNKLGGATVIKDIPREMLPKNKKPLKEAIRREYDKPEHWITPKQEIKRTRGEVFESEKVNIEKKMIPSRGCRLLMEANRQPLRPHSSGFLTAKGYISRRIDNDE